MARWREDEILWLFSAKFDGRCKNCWQDIAEGDSVGYVDDVLSCEECCEASGSALRGP